MAYPPSALEADFNNTTNLIDTHPNHHNALANAVNDIVGVLGNDPAGSFDDVQTLLEAIHGWVFATGDLTTDDDVETVNVNPSADFNVSPGGDATFDLASGAFTLDTSGDISVSGGHDISVIGSRDTSVATGRDLNLQATRGLALGGIGVIVNTTVVGNAGFIGPTGTPNIVNATGTVDIDMDDTVNTWIWTEGAGTGARAKVSVASGEAKFEATGTGALLVRLFVENSTQAQLLMRAAASQDSALIDLYDSTSQRIMHVGEDLDFGSSGTQALHMGPDVESGAAGWAAVGTLPAGGSFVEVGDDDGTSYILLSANATTRLIQVVAVAAQSGPVFDLKDSTGSSKTRFLATGAAGFYGATPVAAGSRMEYDPTEVTPENIYNGLIALGLAVDGS